MLSCGHSSITLYTQLYLGGFGLELDDLKSLRTWGSKTPGHPEHGHTAGVETTTGPLGQGVGNAVGMAMAARRERGLFDPDAAEGESRSTTTSTRSAATATSRRASAARRPSLAGHQQLGNLTLIYDDNQISIEGDTDIAFSEDVAARYEAYGWHVQTVDWTNGGHDVRRGRRRRCRRRSRRPSEVTDKPSFIVLRTIIAWPAPNAQNTGKAHGSALGDDEVAATKKILGFDPDQTFEVADRGARAHPRAASSAARGARAEWQEQFDAWAASNAERRRALLRPACRPARCPTAGPTTCPSFDADAKGVATRKASGEVLTAIAPDAARAVGRLRRPRRVQQHHPEGRAVVPPGGAARPRSARATRYGRVLHFGIREHAMGSIMNGIAAARRHPRLRRHVPGVLRLHARRRSGSPR